MHLYHFSEDPNISEFVPRVKSNRTDMPPVVWAIDDEHQFTFYFPRDCPRIVYTRSDAVSAEDERLFFGAASSDIVVTVEKDWYEAISRATLYRYTLPAETFELFDPIAGYYVSTKTIVPVRMDPMDDLLGRLMKTGVELRFAGSLHPLKEAIVRSTLDDYGIHRFHNAKPPEIAHICSET